MIHEEIVTYEVAKLAKEKGFNEYEACNHIYEDDEQWHTLTTYTNAKGIDWSKDKFTVAPTQSLLQRWLREEKGYYTWPFFNNDELKWTYVVEERRGDKWFSLIINTPNYDSYEEAMENALKFVLEKLVIIENNS